MESDVKRRLYLGEKADALHYVVIELFLRAGFAKQYYQPNGHPDWVLSDLGQAEPISYNFSKIVAVNHVVVGRQKCKCRIRI